MFSLQPPRHIPTLPDDRQGISQVRKQSIKADEDHPVERIEAESLRRGALQDNDLLTRGQVLGFE